MAQELWSCEGQEGHQQGGGSQQDQGSSRRKVRLGGGAGYAYSTQSGTQAIAGLDCHSMQRYDCQRHMPPPALPVCWHITASMFCCRDEGADILILARSDARQAESLDEALWRAAAFADAGADILFIDALASVEEMKAFTSLGGAAAKLPKVRDATAGATTLRTPQGRQQNCVAVASG